MDPVRYAQLQQIFESARNRSGADRASYLDAACAEDHTLRAEVERLLEHAEQETDPGQPFSELQIERVRQQLEHVFAPSVSGVPAKIGRYRIVRRIAVGGMGVVYEAEQDAPRRRVAVKLLPVGHLTPERRQRFDQETDVLGRLQHPGIAQIFDASTCDLGDGSQPYFAMEYIDGVDLRTYAARADLDVTRRLLLIAEIADAMHYAHEQGIVHRDLKPENVLVDARGRAKVLDFGVARATETSPAISTVVTHAGQLIGTLAYMAPEQLSGHPDAVTVRADVYALGVMLFELLTERLPHDVAGLPATAAMHLLADADAPRITRFAPELRGDVETIVGAALAKDPAARYDSAAALAADLRRAVQHEPICARPPSRLYRARKFTRRNRTLVGGVAATMAVLLAGLVVAIVLGGRERVQRERADRAVVEARRNEARVISSVMERAIASLESGAVWDAYDAFQTVPEGRRGWGWRLNALRLPTVLDLPYEMEAFSDRPEDLPEWWFRGEDELIAAVPGERCLRIESLVGGAPRRLFEDTPFRGAGAPSSEDRLIAWTGTEALLLDLGSESIRTRWPITGDVTDSSMSDDGRVVALKTGRRTWTLWIDGVLRRSFEAPADPDLVHVGVAVTPDGTRVIENRERSLRVIDLATEHVDTIAPPAPHDRVYGVPCADDILWHAWRNADPTDGVLGRISSRRVVPIHGPARTQALFTVTRDGRLAAQCGRSGWVVRRTDDGSIPQVSRFQDADGFFAAGTSYIVAPKLSPGGTRALVYSTERAPWVVSLTGEGDAPRMHVYRDHPSFVYHAAVSHDGSLIASHAPADALVRVWDARTGETVGTLERSVVEYGSRDALLAFTEDDDALVVSTPWPEHATTAVVRWDLVTGAIDVHDTEQPATVGNHTPLLETYLDVLAPTSRARLSQKVQCDDDGAVAVWRDYLTGFNWPEVFTGAPPSGPRWRVVPTPERTRVFDVVGLSMHPTDAVVAVVGRRIAAPGAPTSDSTLTIRALADGAVRTTVALDTQLWCVAYAPDGGTIALGTDDGQILLIETESYTVTARVQAHSGYVYSLVWAADGHRLISTSGDGTVCVWDDRGPAFRATEREAWMARRARVGALRDLAAQYPTLTGADRTAARIELLRRRRAAPDDAGR